MTLMIHASTAALRSAGSVSRAVGGLSACALALAAWATSPMAFAQPADGVAAAPPRPSLAASLAETSAQVGRAAAERPGKIVASGVVPDEATRQAVLTQLRSRYGAERVVDQIGVGNLVAPPSWGESLRKVLALPALQRVSRGQLQVKGNVIEVSGEVENEAVRQQVLSDISTQLNPTYTVRSSLRVAAAVAPPPPDQQARVDATLANRTVEFLPASATLTPAGQQILDELVPILAGLQGKRFEVIGHTDADGDRAANILLSAHRADAVRQYLAGKGVPYAAILTSGAGPDHPVADNTTPEGRARNRRIEFKMLR